VLVELSVMEQRFQAVLELAQDGSKSASGVLALAGSHRERISSSSASRLRPDRSARRTSRRAAILRAM
jgi:hypothetical protein